MSGPIFNRSQWLRVMTSVFLCMTMMSCSAMSQSGESEPAPQPLKQQTQPEPLKEPNIPAFTAPLTGLPVEQPVLERPLAIMINNAPAARPQAGLSEADMVYEVLAEGGITRLVAFFQSHGGNVKIGPVRSIRPYLIELGETYGALPIHAGEVQMLMRFYSSNEKSTWMRFRMGELTSGEARIAVLHTTCTQM